MILDRVLSHSFSLLLFCLSLMFAVGKLAITQRHSLCVCVLTLDVKLARVDSAEIVCNTGNCRRKIVVARTSEQARERERERVMF